MVSAEGEEPPRFAAYKLDAAGRPSKKIGTSDGKSLHFTEHFNGATTLSQYRYYETAAFSLEIT